MTIQTRIKYDWNEFCFLLSFSIYIIAVILSYSTLNTGRAAIYIARVLLFTNASIQFAVRENVRLVRLLFFVGILLVSTIIKIKTGYWSILDIGLMMYGSIGVSFDRIVRTYRFAATSSILFIIGLYFCNIIPDNAFTREGFVRHSFGFIYATDLAALIFYILLADFYIAHTTHQKTWLRYGIYAILSVLLYYFCNARLGMVCILLLIPADLYLKFRRGKLLWIEKFLLSYCVPLFAGLMIGIVQYYIKYPRHPLLSALDRILSFRLYYSKMGVIIYGYKLFGQKIEMHGAGEKDYFFIDSSYMNIALVYGIVILVLVVLFFAKVAHKRTEKHELLIPVIILLIAVNSIVGQQMLDIAYDVFLLLFFADFKSSIQDVFTSFLKTERNKKRHILKKENRREILS